MKMLITNLVAEIVLYTNFTYTVICAKHDFPDEICVLARITGENLFSTQFRWEVISKKVLFRLLQDHQWIGDDVGAAR